MLISPIVVNRPVELAVAHACNLSCEGCSHFSDYKHKWMISLDEVDEWLRPWSKRIHPAQLFNILGGEPTLHKDLCEILEKARDYFPTVRFGMTTNGFYLHRHPDLPNVLKKLDIEIKVSIHSNEKEYMDRVGGNLEMAREWSQNGVKVDWAEVQTGGWRKNYLGYGKDMRPFNDKNPRSSWECCMCRCYQIVDGNIWKCPQVAYLKMQYEKYELCDEWKPYLKWEPLTPKHNMKEIKEFFKREEEYICGMCPAKTHLIPRTSPLKFGCSPQLVELEINV